MRYLQAKVAAIARFCSPWAGKAFFRTLLLASVMAAPCAAWPQWFTNLEEGKLTTAKILYAELSNLLVADLSFSEKEAAELIEKNTKTGGMDNLIILHQAVYSISIAHRRAETYTLYRNSALLQLAASENPKELKKKLDERYELVKRNIARLDQLADQPSSKEAPSAR